MNSIALEFKLDIKFMDRPGYWAWYVRIVGSLFYTVGITLHKYFSVSEEVIKLPRGNRA